MSLSVASERGEAERPPPAHDLPPIEAVNISKRFGPTIALKDVSFEVAAHECHALVGRNGAGKSTMVGILTGLRQPDTGVVRFNGEPAPSVANREAWRQKVACVYQHSTVIPALSVAENLFIDRQPDRYGMIDWRGMRLKARRLLDQWSVDVNVDSLAGGLTIATRQLVEIARALSHGARLIILDEPTAQLDGDEIARLFRHMQELQKDGVTFLFISHHLQEVYDICQTVTVLRDARHIVTAPVSQLPKDRLIECMTGEAADLPTVVAGAKRIADDKPMLAVADLSGEGYEEINFAIERGEIVGITGATSSGRIAVAEAIAGLSRPTNGNVLVQGSRLALGDVPVALALGIACVPQDRHRQGLVLGQSICDNVTMTIGEQLGPAGFVLPRAQAKVAREAIGSLGIVTSGADQAVVELSGGNQQKVVVGRALASKPRVLVLIDPTAGVDIKSKAQIHAIVDRERRAGTAIVLSSSEIEDLRICDRVLVMFRGKLTREFTAGWRDGDLISAIEGVGHHERG
jgi:simple sugar transport system ATP-binding protein